MVEVGVVHQPYEPLVEQIGVGKRLSISAPAVISRKPDICRLTRKMLRVGRASNGLV